MNIVTIVPYFYPAWAYGGPAKLVYDSSRYVSDNGHTVHILTSDAYDSKKRMPKQKRILPTKTLVVRYFRNINNTLAYKFNIFFTPGFFVAAIFEVWWADIVHMHDFYTAQNAWAALLSVIFRKPYIISVHGCLELTRMQQRSLFKQMYLFLFGKFMLIRATAVIATSANEAAAYRSFGVDPKRIIRLQHGVNSQEFETTVTKSAAREALQLPKKSVIVTFLGRIHAIKGLDLLVAAIDILRSEKIHFVIAGSDDGYKETLKTDIATRGLAHKITLMGTCFGQEKAALFKASDIFVYPSYSEGFSLGILEAASIGLPLVITTGCHFDTIARVGAGKVVPPDSNMLAQAIAALADAPSERKKCGNNARQLVERKYSTKRVYDLLSAIYLRYA